MNTTSFKTALISLFFTSFLSATVPSPTIRKPNAPYFMESLDFRTMQVKIFTPEVSGMLSDPYSDLIWNPAFVLKSQEKSIYIDFNLRNESTLTLTVPTYTDVYLSSQYSISPRWYSSTQIQIVQTSPLFNFGLILPVNSKLSLAFTNQTLFDYAPFRTATYWDYYRWAEDSYVNNTAVSELKQERLEIDDNQQTVWGSQSEMTLGYKFSPKLDLGLRFGHLIYRHDGNLYDSKWGHYPHSSYADLNDETLNIDGDHFEAGGGFVFHIDEKTRFGGFANLMKGKSTELSLNSDSSDSWYEQELDDRYYDKNHYRLDNRKSYESDGTRSTVRLTFEMDIAQNLIFRSFGSAMWVSQDITGNNSSADTSYNDYTYDYWVSSGVYEFQRQESHDSRESEISGTGSEKESQFNWFASLVYAPQNQWSVFGGIFIQKTNYVKKITETADYSSHDFTDNSGYIDTDYRTYNYYENRFVHHIRQENWKAILPIGVQAVIAKGFSALIGVDLQFTLEHETADAELVYPRKYTKYWTNGNLVLYDLETNRAESFSSDPAKEFQRTNSVRFGIVYRHPCGAMVYIRSNGDILNTTGWDIGFEFLW